MREEKRSGNNKRRESVIREEKRTGYTRREAVIREEKLL